MPAMISMRTLAVWVNESSNIAILTLNYCMNHKIIVVVYIILIIIWEVLFADDYCIQVFCFYTTTLDVNFMQGLKILILFLRVDIFYIIK